MEKIIDSTVTNIEIEGSTRVDLLVGKRIGKLNYENITVRNIFEAFIFGMRKYRVRRASF